MSDASIKIWNTCGYVRLSREDGDKEESNSVTGQKDLIRDFLSRHPELRECDMKVDDGYTGSNFDRPAFQKMMEAVRAGKINCIVVKDLSRFGRDHLEAGEYIERIFPFLGVRFIAINDHYDSEHRNVESDELIIPFKNLINEAYCRDTSIKIRSQLEIKRKRGDFIGSFAVFGYLKDPDDKHRLVVDDFAADVVRDIFKWKLEGISAGDIADRLNAMGIPTPLDYKRRLGMRYTTKFRTKEESTWSAGMILRILKNPIYIGVLEQGKVTTPNYKVKKIVEKPRDEWAVVEDHHEAIIERFDFESVQKVLALDTRTSVNHWRPQTVYAIIRDRQYIGSIVFGKRVRQQIGVRKQTTAPLGDWIVVDDHHEAIVSKDLFQRAQESLGGTYKQHTKHVKSDNPLSKKVICGVCGYAMILHGKVNRYYSCHTPRTVPDMDCFQGKIYENDIMEMVVEAIRVCAQLAVEEKRLRSVEKEKREVQLQTLKQEIRSYQTLQQQITEESRILYEAYAMDGSMSRTEYADKKAALLARREKACEDEAAAKQRLESLWNGESKFIEKYKGLTDLDKLTAELAADLLRFIKIWPDGRVNVELNYLDEIPHAVVRNLLAAI